MAGVSRSTWHYRSSPRVRVAEPVPHKKRAYPSRISDADRAVVAARITAGWADGHSVDHSFATSWDDRGDARLPPFVVADRSQRLRCRQPRFDMAWAGRPDDVTRNSGM